MHERLGQADGLERRLQGVGDRRFAEVAETERADRDPELRPGHHQRDVLHRGQRGPGGAAPRLGARFDLGPAGGDQGELGTDEEGVGDEQERADRDRGRGAHDFVLGQRSMSEADAVDAQRVHRQHRERDLVLDAVLVVGAQRHGVAGGGDARQPVADQAGHGLVVLVLGQLDPDRVADLVRSHQSGQRPAAVRLAPGRLLARVVLVADFADDLLDEVLERDEAVDVAELVDDERHLQAARAQRVEQVVELEAGRDQHRRIHHDGDRRVAALLEGHADRLLDVHDAGEVTAGPDDGKAGASAGARLLDDDRDRVILRDGGDAAARRHDLVRAALAERERALEQRRGTALERSLLRRPAHERRELLRGARGGQLLLRLDADAAQHRVRRAVEEAHDHARRAGEATQEALHGPRGRERLRDREVLRDELAEDHRHAGGQDERDRERDARHGTLRHPGAGERPTHEIGDRRLGEEADQQVRQRDADLRRRQLRGQAAQRGLHAESGTVALLGGTVDRRAVDGHERELRRDERAARHDERERDHDQEDFDQRASLRHSAARTRLGLQLGSSVIDQRAERHARERYAPSLKRCWPQVHTRTYATVRMLIRTGACRRALAVPSVAR